MGENLYLENFNISRKEREDLLNQKGIVIWFTGFSGSGKSTIANEVEKYLYKKKKLTYILDGDNTRLSLNKDLGFTNKDRKENIRRIGEVSKILVNLGVITLCTFVSPLKEDRENLRQALGKDFIEVFVNCSLDECANRDPKGLYKKAKQGLIKNFTGIDSVYEKPESPEITLDTSVLSINQCVAKVVDYIGFGGENA